jgi:hypothetical protein
LLFLKSLSLLECEEDISFDEDSPLGMALRGKPCSFDVVVVMNLFFACLSRSSAQRSYLGEERRRTHLEQKLPFEIRRTR